MMTPRASTRAEVVSYVERAAELVASSGSAACETFRNPDWHSGDWYIFIFDEKGTLTCHPARMDLVGTRPSELVDPSGKVIGEEFIRAATGPEGRGWVDYVWEKPGHPSPVPKSSYVMRVTVQGGRTYVVGSGGFDLQ